MLTIFKTNIQKIYVAFENDIDFTRTSNPSNFGIWS